MNLMQTMMSPMMSMMTLSLMQQKNSKMMKNMSKISMTMILFQAMFLHMQNSSNTKHIFMLFTSNTNMNNLSMKSLNLSMDSLSTTLLILTTMLMTSCILMSEKTIYHSIKSLLICLFTATTILFLTFTTSNLIIFYIMFESSMIPLMMIMGLWGSRKEKMQATYYFLLYTMMGSLPLFLTMLTIKNKFSTFNSTTIQNMSMNNKTEMQLFLGFFLAFAIKTPLIPWHSWLPLAHVEAPGMGSVILAGMLLKLGTYGFLRFTIPLLPNTSKFLSPLIMSMSMMSMWLASMNSLRQNDMKRMIAYSSMAHMGIMTAACFSSNPMSTKGAMMLMMSHGLTSGTLFMLASYLYERHKSRLMKNYQGISLMTPVLAMFLMMTSLAHMGTPGSMNFMGEYLCLMGLWELHPSITIISTMSLLITTTYLLLLYMQMSSSKPMTHNNYKIQDLSQKETQAMLMLMMPNISTGLLPYPMMNDKYTMH